MPDDKDKAVSLPPRVQEVVGVNLYPQQETVQIFARPALAISAQETVLPWAIVEGMYLSILEMRLRARGLAVGLQAAPDGGAVAMPR